MLRLKRCNAQHPGQLPFIFDDHTGTTRDVIDLCSMGSDVCVKEAEPPRAQRMRQGGTVAGRIEPTLAVGVLLFERRSRCD